MFSVFKLSLLLVLVLFLSTQAVLSSPVESSAPLTRLSIPKDIGLIPGNGRCHTTLNSFPATIWKRGTLERDSDTLLSLSLNGKDKTSSVLKWEKETKPVAVDVCFLASSPTFVPCCLHRPSPQPLGRAPCRGTGRSLGVTARPQGRAVAPHTTRSAGRGAGHGWGDKHGTGRGLTLSYNTSSSWGLGRKAQLSARSQYEHAAILYNSAHNTHCESPPQAARGQAWNTWEPQEGCSHCL